MRYSRLAVICISALLLTVVASASGLCASQDNVSAPAVTNPSAQGSGSTGGGCGSAPDSCGAAPGAQDPKSLLNLTLSQKKRLAEIDSRSSARGKKLEKSFDQRRNELAKLIADPRTTDAAIRRKMHQVADAYAELQLNDVLAERAKDKVYTPQQKKLLAKLAGTEGGGCGCGSAPDPASYSGCGSSGGCGGAPTK